MYHISRIGHFSRLDDAKSNETMRFRYKRFTEDFKPLPSTYKKEYPGFANAKHDLEKWVESFLKNMHNKLEELAHEDSCVKSRGQMQRIVCEAFRESLALQAGGVPDTFWEPWAKDIIAVRFWGIHQY